MIAIVHAGVLLHVVLAYGVFALGLLGWARGGALLGVLGLAVGAAAGYAWFAARRAPLRAERWRSEAPWLALALVALLPLVHVFWLPVLVRDDLIYHMVVPKQIAASGALVFDPYNLNTNLPMLFELPLVLAEAAGDWLSPFALNWAVLVGLVLALLVFLRERLGLAAGLALALALGVAYTPAVYQLVQSGYVELFLALLVLLSFTHYLAHLDGEGESHWYWAAAFAGLAAATKYLGLYYLLLLLLWEGSRRRGIRPFYLGVALGVGLCAPWYVKNWLWTGNPVFPLLSEFFPSPYLSVPRYVQFQNVAHAYNQGRDLHDFLLLPWRLLRAADWSPQPGALGFGGKLSCLYVLAFLGIGFRRRGRAFVSCAFVGFFALWAALSQQVRFLLPVLIPAAGYGALRLARAHPRGPVAVYGLVALALCQSAWNVWGSAREWRTAEYLRGEIPREELLRHHLPDTYPAVRHANARLDPERDRVMLIGTFGRSYYYDVPVLVNTYFDNEPFDRAFDRQRPAAELAEAFLAREGITHLQIQWQYLERYYADDPRFDLAAFRHFIETRTAAVAEGVPLRRVLPAAAGPLGAVCSGPCPSSSSS